VKLNLACGHVILPAEDGWINLDRLDGPGIDVVADVPPIPLEDSSVDHILASHFLEHVPNGRPIIDLMNECHRILEPGGTMHVEVPYWDSEDFVRDPTHVAPWNAEKFRYFTSEFAYLRYGITVWSSATASRSGSLVYADLVK
jgi:predicted SAM-dependent methyltransferase